MAIQAGQAAEVPVEQHRILVLVGQGQSDKEMTAEMAA
jgi:hypothetical protein